MSEGYTFCAINKVWVQGKNYEHPHSAWKRVTGSEFDAEKAQLTIDYGNRFIDYFCRSDAGRFHLLKMSFDPTIYEVNVTPVDPVKNYHFVVGSAVWASDRGAADTHSIASAWQKSTGVSLANSTLLLRANVGPIFSFYLAGNKLFMLKETLDHLRIAVIYKVEEAHIRTRFVKTEDGDVVRFEVERPQASVHVEKDSEKLEER